MASLSDARALFEERRDELHRYISFLGWLRDDADLPYERRAPFKTAMAASYVIIYNLVEATMTALLLAIQEEFRVQQVEFDRLKPAIRREVLNRFARYLNKNSGQRDEQASRLVPLTSEILYAFDQKELFAGNIDARKIREVADSFGFQPAQHDLNTSKDGSDLRAVMSRRNELAHGAVSFSETASNLSLEELREMTECIVVYMNAVVDGVDAYIGSKA